MCLGAGLGGIGGMVSAAVEGVCLSGSILGLGLILLGMLPGMFVGGIVHLPLIRLDKRSSYIITLSSGAVAGIIIAHLAFNISLDFD